MQESIVFLVRVQCRRTESSRSLSHLLMSVLLKLITNQNDSLHTGYRLVPTSMTLNDFERRNSPFYRIR